MGQIKVPVNLCQAVKFTVDPEVSVWVTDILKQEGWKLVMEMNENQYQGKHKGKEKEDIFDTEKIHAKNPIPSSTKAPEMMQLESFEH